MRLSILLSLLLLATSTSFSRDAELDQLARWIEGSYTNTQQASTNPDMEPLRLHMRRIWHSEPDGYWFYSELAFTSKQHESCRQRFYYLHRRADRKIVVESFTLDAPEQVLRAWYDTTRLDGFKSDALTRENGCDVVYARKGKTFVGASSGKDCRSEFSEGGYESREMTVGESEIKVWDRLVEPGGKPPGATSKSGYVFAKLDAREPGLIAVMMDRAQYNFLTMRFDEAIATIDSLRMIDPTNADAMALRSAAQRYNGETDLAVMSAIGALALSPCHALAHSALADLYNPQYSDYQRANIDSAWAHYMAAIECDPKSGDAWMGIWVESMRRVDDELRGRSLVALRETDFMTPAALEVARWYLRDVPPNAVLITGGDMDTYPLAVVQQTEGYRRDVSVVNSSLLNLSWYVRYVRDYMGVDIPFTDAEIDNLAPYLNDESKVMTIDRQVIDRWTDQVRQRALRRPIVFSTTWQIADEAPALSGWGHNVGTHVLPGDVEYVDIAAFQRRLRDLDGRRFYGPFVSPRDMSPVRRLSEPGINGVLRVAYNLANAQVATGDTTGARATIEWTRSFVASAHNTDWDRPLREFEEEHGR